MTTYIALLRGINVGGHRLLPMKALAQVLEDLGMMDVRTYIQSGNVVFRHASARPAAVRDAIAPALEKAFGFRPELLVLGVTDLDRAIAGNPFPKAAAEPALLHVMFLQAAPKKPRLEMLERLKQPNERFALKRDVFYLHAPDGIGRSKLAAAMEKALGVAGTVRNFRTVLQLKTMADALRVVLVAAALTLAAAAPMAAQSRGVERVAWLQGCWTLDTPDRVVEEQWMAPRAGTLVGMGRTVRGGQLAEYELVIEGSAGGQARRVEFPYRRAVCATN